MVDRGFGIELEGTYGDTTVAKSNFDPDWWNQAEEVDFSLGDEPVTRSGGSRMNKRARAGIMKPTGSTSADADLQQLAWYFRGYLDNYKYTAGSSGSTVHTHEYWGLLRYASISPGSSAASLTRSICPVVMKYCSRERI